MLYAPKSDADFPMSHLPVPSVAPTPELQDFASPTEQSQPSQVRRASSKLSFLETHPTHHRWKTLPPAPPAPPLDESSYHHHQYQPSTYLHHLHHPKYHPPQRRWDS